MTDETYATKLHLAVSRFRDVQAFANMPLSSAAYAEYAQAAYVLRHAQRVLEYERSQCRAVVPCSRGKSDGRRRSEKQTELVRNK